MSLFNLTDIDFKEEVRNESTNQNLGVDFRYHNNIFRYPIDLGNYDKGHYMIINIGQQTKTQYKSADGDMGAMTVEQNLNLLQTENKGSVSVVNATNNVVGKALGLTEDAINYGIEAVNALRSETNKITPLHLNSSNTYEAKYREATTQLNKPSFLRTVRRTTDTIALYMPDTLQFSYNQGYSDVSMNQGALPLIAVGGEAGYSLIEGLKGGKGVKDSVLSTLKNASPFIASRAAGALLGGPGDAVFAGQFGAVNNPQLELLYSSPEFRTFRFEFMLYPRSQKEALEIQKIINRLRFHQAPEVLGQGSVGSTGGLFLVPPSEFDISFYYNGDINPNIPKISTCVLAGIDTDYAPNGQFAAYEASDTLDAKLGGTGMPVGIRLSLTFKETQILTKFDYAYLPGGQTSQVTR
jgi:hypothetical protein